MEYKYKAVRSKNGLDENSESQLQDRKFRVDALLSAISLKSTFNSFEIHPIKLYGIDIFTEKLTYGKCNHKEADSFGIYVFDKDTKDFCESVCIAECSTHKEAEKLIVILKKIIESFQY